MNVFVGSMYCLRVCQNFNDKGKDEKGKYVLCSRTNVFYSDKVRVNIADTANVDSIKGTYISKTRNSCLVETIIE